jgi:hypothetical protein
MPVAALALGGVMMAVGYWYRAAAAAVFLSWGYFFAVESTRTYWQSHYYMELLLAFLMIWLPAARSFSLDARSGARRPSPGRIPFWTILVLRGQLVIIYFYAGVAKLSADWLLDAVPLRWVLREEHVTAPFKAYLSPALFGLLNDTVHSLPFAYLLSHLGVAFDLSVGFLLLIRRTRILAMIGMILFHVTNHVLIYDNIGWFPLAGATTALIFLDPDWPGRLLRWMRQPRWAPPDRQWLIGGAVLIPVLGAALGWKLKPSPSPAEKGAASPLGNGTVVLVLLWLSFQGLAPIRHHLIPGDGRFTYEGLSFSWRLKADDRSALPIQITVDDVKILETNAPGPAVVHWPAWHGDRVWYQSVAPAQVDWASFPEIVILLEPLLGERILFNPYAAASPNPQGAEGSKRVNAIWQSLYGRAPRAVLPTLPIDGFFTDVPAGLRVSGNHREAAFISGLAAEWNQARLKGQDAESMAGIFQRLRALLQELVRLNTTGELIGFLRRLHPFAMNGHASPRAPFLLIDDPQLMDASRTKVDRAKWRNSPAVTGAPKGVVSEGGEAMEIVTEYPGLDHWQWLPQACLVMPREHPARAPHIWWNSRRDLSPSKFIHISNQPFYLRRYARRIARLWEKEYGRRPSVYAAAMVSFNGRPHQPLVAPDIDLASVPVTWFGHNAWIRDLELARIPRERLNLR